LKKKIIYLALAIIPGAAGAWLRYAQAASAFDPRTGLSDRANIYSAMLASLTVAALAAYLIINLIYRPSCKPVYIVSKLGRGRLERTAMILAGALIAMSGCVYIYGAVRDFDIPGIMRAAFTLLTGIILMILVRPLKRRKNAEEFRALSLIPIAWIILTTAVEFRGELANPVIDAYVYTILALAAALPVMLQVMGLFHKRGIYKLGPFVFLAAAYFNVITAVTGLCVLINPPYIDRETSRAFLLTNGVCTILIAAAIMLYSLAFLLASSDIADKWRFSELMPRKDKDARAKGKEGRQDQASANDSEEWEKPPDTEKAPERPEPTEETDGTQSDGASGNSNTRPGGETRIHGVGRPAGRSRRARGGDLDFGAF